MKALYFLTATLLASVSYCQEIIPMEVTRSGHLMVKAKISGVEGNFIFDTAGGLHIVSSSFYKRIKAFSKDSSYLTAFRHTGERIDGPIYRFEKVAMGSIEQNNSWVGVYSGFDNQGFDGLISAKLIENQPLTVDIKNKQLIVETPKSVASRQGNIIPIVLHENRNRSLDIFFNLKVDGKYDALVEFDTGAGYSPVLLHSRYMQWSKLDTTQMEIRQSGTGFGKTEKTYFDKNKKLHILLPDTKVGGNPAIIFKSSLIYDGLVSHVILGEKIWTLDIPNRRMIVAP